MAMRVVTFKLDETVLEKLDRYAMRTGRSRSEVIRRAIEMLLAHEDIIVPRAYAVKIRIW